MLRKCLTISGRSAVRSLYPSVLSFPSSMASITISYLVTAQSSRLKAQGSTVWEI